MEGGENKQKGEVEKEGGERRQPTKTFQGRNYMIQGPVSKKRLHAS